MDVRVPLEHDRRRGEARVPFTLFRSCGAARRGADVHSLAVASVNTQDLDRLVVRGAEPVRQLRVELGDLAGTHRDVVLAEDQSHPSREHGQPFVAVVDT